MDLLMQLVLLATLAESITEYFFVPWVRPYEKYVSALVGVGLALNFQVDLFHAVSGMVSFSPIVGYILTGILLGRGSNFVHDFWVRFVVQGITFPKKED